MSGWVSMRFWWWAAVAAAGLGWLLAPMPGEVPAVVQPRRDAWTLPPLPLVADQASLAVKVMGAPYWGAAPPPAAAAAASAPDPGWRIAAIYGLGGERSVLLTFAAEGKPPRRLGIGDKLPDGQRIEAIGDRAITVKDGSRSVKLEVERRAN